jgi:hypothetical protein
LNEFNGLIRLYTNSNVSFYLNPQTSFIVRVSNTITSELLPLEYIKASDSMRLSLLVLHDYAQREYAYGPAQGLPDTKVGRFTQSLYEQAQNNSWIIVSMKNDWKQIFSF